MVLCDSCAFHVGFAPGPSGVKCIIRYPPSCSDSCFVSIRANLRYTRVCLSAPFCVSDLGYSVLIVEGSQVDPPLLLSDVAALLEPTVEVSSKGGDQDIRGKSTQSVTTLRPSWQRTVWWSIG